MTSGPWSCSLPRPLSLLENTLPLSSCALLSEVRPAQIDHDEQRKHGQPDDPLVFGKTNVMRGDKYCHMDWNYIPAGALLRGLILYCGGCLPHSTKWSL
jgi:hypothetical protein